MITETSYRDEPAEALELRDRSALLDYASGIALDKKDVREVRALAETLEKYLTDRCVTRGEQAAMLAAMQRAHRNRPGGADPYYGHIEDFLDAVQELYSFLQG